jgi:hypothetical protein
VPGPHLIYGFLTTGQDAVVKPIHPKYMPVILIIDERRGVLDACTAGRGVATAATGRRLKIIRRGADKEEIAAT